MNIYESNLNLFEDYLSTQDVLLVPKAGQLKRRKEATLHPFLYSSPMDTVTDSKFSESLYLLNHNPVFCRFFSYKEKLEYVNLLEQYNWPASMWYTVGANKKDLDELKSILDELRITDAKLNISVDVAHGDTVHLAEVYKTYTAMRSVKKLMSGTVATAESARAVHDHGCTHIRVGIGPGSACSTRVVTGCGVPNLTAVFNIYNEFLTESDPPIIIADGGIKASGDIVKYLSAGADAVMIGSLFSKTPESPGWQRSWFDALLGRPPVKRYRGQASRAFQMDRRGFVSGAPEGVTAPPQHPEYSLQAIVEQLESGLSSALSYLGLKSSKELNPKNVQFIKITQNGLQESKPHILS